METVLAVTEKVETGRPLAKENCNTFAGRERKAEKLVDDPSKIFRGCTENADRTNLMPGQMLSGMIRH